MMNQPIPFPRRRPPPGIVLTDDEHHFVLGIVRNFHGREIEQLLTSAAEIPGGRRIAGTDEEQYDLMEAIGVEANGFLRLEEEDAGRPLCAPKRGGTAARLLKIYDKIEQHLS